MRRAEVSVHGIPAGLLLEIEPGRHYRFEYRADYAGEPVSLRMPVQRQAFDFDAFPPFFDGLFLRDSNSTRCCAS